MKIVKKNILWIAYFIFVVIAVIYRGDKNLFTSSGPFAPGKYLVWAVYLFFLGYSIYCSTKESFFKSIKMMFPLHWARQIGIDLYIGLLMSVSMIYLNEGSLLVFAIWLVPILIYGNLVSLLYVALNYDGIVAHFI
ncbi:MAG: hypothetical protein RIF34_02645 [Candidatus Kapaibacterium sp.]